MQKNATEVVQDTERLVTYQCAKQRFVIGLKFADTESRSLEDSIKSLCFKEVKDHRSWQATGDCLEKAS